MMREPSVKMNRIPCLVATLPSTCKNSGTTYQLRCNAHKTSLALCMPGHTTLPDCKEFDDQSQRTQNPLSCNLPGQCT